MTLFIGVYKAGDRIVTSGALSLSDLDLQEAYRAIDSVATGSIHVPSLFCDLSKCVGRVVIIKFEILSLPNI